MTASDVIGGAPDTPFGRALHAVLDDPGVTDQALRVYLALARCLVLSGPLPPTADLCREGRCSRGTLYRVLKQLAAAGHILIDRDPSGGYVSIRLAAEGGAP